MGGKRRFCTGGADYWDFKVRWYISPRDGRVRSLVLVFQSAVSAVSGPPAAERPKTRDYTTKLSSRQMLQRLRQANTISVSCQSEKAVLILTEVVKDLRGLPLQ